LFFEPLGNGLFVHSSLHGDGPLPLFREVMRPPCSCADGRVLEVLV
jgi:hypothetical protein